MSINAQDALQRTIEHREIFYDEMLSLMRQIMQGEISPVMSAAILTGLRVKKETIGEITAAAEILREMAAPVSVAPPHENFLDIVGTGGDGANTFNISSTASFVAAAAGARVAKHGNRGVSSSSGAADIMQALGVNLELQPQQVASCIEEVGIGFMFAPKHHGAMKNIAPIRAEMGVRTLFNILGPLINPANAPNTLMGVFHADLVGILSRVMQRLGANHVLVVYGLDGLDEISLGASSMVSELRDNQVCDYTIHPEDFGLTMSATRNLRVNSVEESKKMLLSVLDNQSGPARDIVILNAGAALYAANLVDSIANGVALAKENIESGAARAKLEQFIRYTQSFS